LTLPYEIPFDDEGTTNAEYEYEEKLSIRFMTDDDIKYIMPLCIEEFGTGSTLRLLDFPFHDLSQISDWWDRVFFETSVALSLRSKMNANLRTEHRAKDPALMVLCRSKGPDEEEVVGMVELSLQAPEADRNPPPFPVPLLIKSWYCRLAGLRLQGWVTNLLIDPRCRGLGYAKILMAATEGIAKSWGCRYILLHADADYRSGKVAQSLYKGLGYEVVTDEGPDEYTWMTGGGGNPFSSIHMIEGVPLLCFKKEL
jgi:ribosomal protein S18 acetylase RimI-like enzyme